MKDSSHQDNREVGSAASVRYYSEREHPLGPPDEEKADEEKADEEKALSSMPTPDRVKHECHAGASSKNTCTSATSHKVVATGNGKIRSSSNRPGAAATARGATQEVHTPMSDQRNAAREALAAHEALRATRLTEPPSGEDGMPLDEEAWLAWLNNVSKPAYARWDAAMDALDAALGYEVGRHPYTFRPICEEVLNGD